MKSIQGYMMIFAGAFFCNAIWENAHAFLYVHYRGNPISEFVLLRAAVVDAAIITSVMLVAQIMPKQYRRICAVLILFTIAIFLEQWALSIGRWAYTNYMPIVPFFNVGVTPTIQLVATMWFALWISRTKSFL